MQMVCKTRDEFELSVAQAAQEPKLRSYNRRSSREVPPSNQFDKMLWLLVGRLLRRSRKREFVGVVNYADSLHFTQKFYFPSQVRTACRRFACETESKELDIVRVPRGSWRTTNKKAREILRSLLNQILPPGGLKMHHIQTDDDVEQVLSTLETSAGWSAYLHSEWADNKKKNLQDGAAVEFIKQCARAKKEGSFSTPVMVFHRSQTGLPYNDDFTEKVPENMTMKTRAVCAVDFYTVLAEACFSRAIQDLMSKASFYAGGKNDSQVESLVSFMRKKHRFWTSIDFSHYDQSVQAWLISDVFDILKELFHQDANFDEELWNVVVHDFIHKVLYGPGGELFSSHNGVPSGSMFTQIIDTLCNFVMLESYLLSREIDSTDMIIMGDDNIFFTDCEVDLTDMQGYMRHTYGMTMHPHKCKSGTNADHPSFLSREWTPWGVYRHPYHILLRMLYPEHFRDYARKQFKPDDVLYAYYLCFPLGVRELFEPDLFRQWLRRYREKPFTVDPKYLSGIARFRLLYQKETMTDYEFRKMMDETLKVA